jgi:MFS transporter, ACDE family, multidrug resistance protein
MLRGIALASLLALGSFTWAMSFCRLIPLLKPIAAEFGKSDAAVGQLATLYSVATGITALIIAPVMDRFGRRSLLKLGAALLLIGIAGTALAPRFVWLFPAHLVAGIGAAFIMPVLFAAAGDLFSDQQKRTQAVGLVIGATGLAPLIGIPVLTQITNVAGWRWASAALLVLVAVMMLSSFWFPANPGKEMAFTARDYVRHYRAVLGNWETNWLITGHMVRGIAWYSALVYMAAYAITEYGMDANRLSLLFVTLGGTFVIATNVVPLTTRFIAPRRLFALSLLVLFANFLSVGMVGGEWSLFIFAVVLSIAGAGVGVGESVLLLDSFPSARGGVMSLRSAGTEFGTAIGAALLGLLLILFGDYATVYRAMGMLFPVTLITLYFSTRRLPLVDIPTPQASAEPAPVTPAQG